MRRNAALAERLRLIMIADPEAAGGRRLRDVVRLALNGGAPAVQLRAKMLPVRETFELALELVAETRRAGALFFVNDRTDVALAAEADGAHLGDDDLPLAAARRIVPPGFLLGRSVATPEQAKQAEAEGADYLGAGSVFATQSKADAGIPILLPSLGAIAAAAGIPTVGIGGINAGNAAAVIAAGATGVAVISAIMGSGDPAGAARELLSAASAPYTLDDS